MNPIINRKQDILYKDLAVDLTAHRVSRAGHELLLTPREFALLAVLVTHCDTALSRSQLLEAAWGYAFIGESRTVDVHINRLRRKLGLQNDIQTVYKVGYRLSRVFRLFYEVFPFCRTPLRGLHWRRLWPLPYRESPAAE